MEIVNESTHRVLAYVDALNRHGVKPSRGLVNEFADDPKRQVTTSPGPLTFSVARMFADIYGSQTVARESYCQYLTRLGWINASGPVELTTAGRALLKALNTPAFEESTADVFEIVLDPGDPFAYVQALAGLATVRSALLVDPYFRIEQLMAIAEMDNIKRVLVGSQLNTQDVTILATGLAALPETRELEIRIAKDLHDRYLIPSSEGSALMLGTSLGGIGKKVSTITTLGEVASRALRSAHEDIWGTATALAARRPKKPSKKTPAKRTVKKAGAS